MSALTRWNPVRTMGRFDPEQVFEDFFRGFRLRPGMREMDFGPAMDIDVTECDGDYCVKANIPGVEKKDIDIIIDGRTVSLTAEMHGETSKKRDEKEIHNERYVGRVFRSFVLPQEVDDAKADAHYENGVLTLTLPKKPDGQHRKIIVS